MMRATTIAAVLIIAIGLAIWALLDSPSDPGRRGDDLNTASESVDRRRGAEIEPRSADLPQDQGNDATSRTPAVAPVEIEAAPPVDKEHTRAIRQALMDLRILTDAKVVALADDLTPEQLEKFAPVTASYRKEINAACYKFYAEAGKLHDEYWESGRVELYAEDEEIPKGVGDEFIQVGRRTEGGKRMKVATRINLRAYPEAYIARREYTSLQRGLLKAAADALGAEVR